MKRLVFALSLILISCGTREAVEVKQFTVKEIETDWGDDAMVRGENLKRLYGAVGLEERLARRGQYFSVRWRGSAAGGPVRVEFFYRQAATGSRMHRLVREVPAAKTGLVEFSVNGAAYQEGGRVTAWRVLVTQGENLLGEKQSFLWE